MPRSKQLEEATTMTGALMTRRMLSAAAALAVIALGGASVAWACSTQAQAGINGGQTSGPVGTQVTVTGRDFGPGPVQVRWNSRGGQLLGEGQGPSFSVPITIPQAPTGVHYIVALQTVGSSTASLAFEVTAPARNNTTSTDSGASGTTSTSASGADEETTTNSTQTNSATNANSTESRPSANTSTANAQTAEAPNTATAGPTSAPTAGQTSQAANPTAATGSPGATANASAPKATLATPARAASANPAVVTNPAGQAVFGGSSAAPAAPAEADSPSAATVSGDTWSGFGADAKPSLLTNAPATPAGSSSTSGLGLGVGLLGAGVVALFAGFAAAEASRKRALAGAERY